jgi:multiple sugar transport system substrate-binding protein
MSARELAAATSTRLPSARLAPTTDPTWDKVKLDVQQTIGLAVQPGGDPRQVLDRLQKNAAESAR